MISFFEKRKRYISTWHVDLGRKTDVAQTAFATSTGCRRFFFSSCLPVHQQTVSLLDLSRLPPLFTANRRLHFDPFHSDVWQQHPFAEFCVSYSIGGGALRSVYFFYRHFFFYLLSRCDQIITTAFVPDRTFDLL